MNEWINEWIFEWLDWTELAQSQINELVWSWNFFEWTKKAIKEWLIDQIKLIQKICNFIDRWLIWFDLFHFYKNEENEMKGVLNYSLVLIICALTICFVYETNAANIK